MRWVQLNLINFAISIKMNINETTEIRTRQVKNSAHVQQNNERNSPPPPPTHPKIHSRNKAIIEGKEFATKTKTVIFTRIYPKKFINTRQ